MGAGSVVWKYSDAGAGAGAGSVVGKYSDAGAGAVAGAGAGAGTGAGAGCRCIITMHLLLAEVMFPHPDPGQVEAPG